MPRIPGRRKKEKLALIIPGQGFQRPGMGREENGEPKRFLEETVEQAKVIVDPIQIGRIRHLLLADVSRLSPEEKEAIEQEMNRTDNAQIALFLLFAAQWEEYRSDEENLIPNVVLGHSAGEPVAAYIAGAYDFETALKFVFSRSHLMNICNSLFPGGMLVISSREKPVSERLVERSLKGTEVEIANLNSPRRIVISGRHDELDWILPKLREKGLRVSHLPNIAGAYHHSKAMASAKEALDKFFSSGLIVIKRPAIRLILNFSGDFEEREKQLRTAFPAQVTSIVKWRQEIETAFKSGVTKFIEFGPNNGPITWLNDFSAWQKIQSSREEASGQREEPGE